MFSFSEAICRAFQMQILCKILTTTLIRTETVSRVCEPDFDSDSTSRFDSDSDSTFDSDLNPNHDPNPNPTPNFDSTPE